MFAAERPDVAYTLVAVDFLDNQAVHTALSRLTSQLAAGTLQALPQVVHSLAEVQAALRQMSQARHVGKIVTRMPAPASAQAPTAGTVLVTGGLGTLGSLTAAWLAQVSKLHVHVTGRSGRFADCTGPLAALLAAGFAGMVSLTSADAASAEDAELLAAAGSSTDRELVGLLHASGLLADATLANQTLKGIRTVYAPKSGALGRLRRRTTLQPGAFEVLFSSIASLLGSPGQANYSAANATLDVLAGQHQTQVSHQERPCC
jgi:hypothetical protein